MQLPLTTSITDLVVGDNSLIQGTQTTFQAGDSITASGSNNRLSLVDSGTAAWTLPTVSVSGVQTIALQNVSGTPVVPAVTAVRGTTTIVATFATTNTNVITLNYGTQSQVVTLTGTADATGAATNAGLYAAAINGMAGATIAVATGVNVVVTGPVSGAALPTITFQSATVLASYPTVTSTANVVGVAASGGTLTSTVDADNFVGATTFVTTQSTGLVVVNDLVQGQAVQMNNGAGALNANYKAAATAATLNVTGGNTGGAVAIAGTGLTSATINSSGGAQSSTAGNVNTLTSVNLPTAVTTLNINAATSLTTGGSAGTAMTAPGLISIIASGAATTVNLGTLAATVTTVNGSGLTAGGITTTLTGAVTSFTGGAGTDTVTTAATTAATASISGGTGTADILVLAASNDVTTAAKAAQYTNFEVLRNGTSSTVDMAIFGSGYTALQTTGNGGFQNLNAAQAGNIRVAASSSGSVFALSNPTGTTDVLSLTLQNNTASAFATEINAAAITVNGFETLNIVSSAGTQNALTLGAVGNKVDFASSGAANLTAINVSGAFDLEINGANTAKALTLTASNTGTFAVEGSFTRGSTIQGNNTLNLFTVTESAADNGSTYIGGAGKDEFTAAKAVLAVNGTFDTVLNGGSGTDVLTISDTKAETVADSIFTNVTNMERLTFANTDAAFVFASGGLFNAAYSAGATVTASAIGAVTATVDLSLYNQNATIRVTTLSDDDATVVKGGSGNDVITVSAVKYTGGAGDMAVSGGAGNDVITVNTIATGEIESAIIITGGAGADTIVVTAGAIAKGNGVEYVVAAGDSTITAFDNISGFRTADGTADDYSDLLQFTGTATIVANTTGQAASGYSNVVFSVTSGLLSFTGAGASSLALTDMIAIAQQAATANLSTVAFRFGANSYVYNENSTGDSLVQLNLVSIVGITDTLTATTAGFVAID